MTSGGVLGFRSCVHCNQTPRIAFVPLPHCSSCVSCLLTETCKNELHQDQNISEVEASHSFILDGLLMIKKSHLCFRRGKQLWAAVSVSSPLGRVGNRDWGDLNKI